MVLQCVFAKITCIKYKHKEILLMDNKQQVLQ